MNKAIFFFLLSTLLLATGCERDPYPLSLDRFDVRWFDDDHSGTQTPGDALEFLIGMSTTDPDAEDQFITEWEFSYTVNNSFGGILQGDEGIRSNTVTLDAEVAIHNLNVPGPGQFEPGDVIEFRLWAVDNWGTQLEQYHRFVLE
ncbi:MAG: hypothetical protein IPJ82_21900 [Lewinellaceae bacterium]|nr:hypothetical protein [Lewinellaceae bacterium]